MIEDLEVYSYIWLFYTLKRDSQIESFPEESLPAVISYSYLISSLSTGVNTMKIRQEFNELIQKYKQDTSFIFLSMPEFADEIIYSEDGIELIMPVMYVIKKFILNTQGISKMSSAELLLYINDSNIPNPSIAPILFSLLALINPEFEQDANLNFILNSDNDKIKYVIKMINKMI